ncbi:ubiquitin conjugating enzyme family protein [Cylindrobasidium torrendii FP15055 ss-10]|uniref:Ubiquitin conjugating enzyme family protein n=1 Tax=Cylindrobasidium torrendii FP15055 ss-10 TaxID=1314674 RepID=A0A0D7BMN1_9AGAR|nr:ubiquitin conjugating enzyme family protein [Cylindrobasidium torrendii FP15055 ss-10]
MDKEIAQLVEMGASAAQARAALQQYKDVMEAAEAFFEGKFDNVRDDATPSAESSSQGKRPRMAVCTPDDEDEDEVMEDDEDDVEDFGYDSDDDQMVVDSAKTDVDPYAGIFYSKDRKEEVIEVEEDPETAVVDGETVDLMMQGEWMKGCPEGSEQSFLFQIYSALTTGACPCPSGCAASVPRNRSDFFSLHESFSAYTNHIRKIVRKTCPQCSKQFCFACGESVNSEKIQRPSAAQDDPLFHCSSLQGVILGVGLSMIEHTFLDQTRSEAEKPRSTKRRKTTPTTRDEDSDEPSLLPPRTRTPLKGGIGYAGDGREDNSGQLEALAAQLAKDKKIGSLLTGVRNYLPDLRREGGGHASDYLPHPTALAHLRRRFNSVCSTLLKNDSLADMSERSVLYYELLEWLGTISSHESLASMMAMPIMAVVSVKPVPVKKGTKTNPHYRERTISYEGSPSPRELLEGIAHQASAALKSLEGLRPHDDKPKELTEEEKRMTIDTKGKEKATSVALSEENQALSSFCHRILSTTGAIDSSLRQNKGDAFVERLHASLPKIFTSATHEYVDAGDTEEDAKKAYTNWAKNARFEYCDLTVPNSWNPEDEPNGSPAFKHYYSQEARNLANMDIPKRSLAIAKELAILTATLPTDWNSSIFLKVDETRVDVIKCLITGPDGTPYSNGCYLFDIFLVQRYNDAPPVVKYMTTGGGKYRFNPNLYADGKVCLSLLGTWQGPGWVSGKSTLLQVLISIQSMILCDEPYLNEPGWANEAGTANSKAYTKNVRRMAVKVAMLDALKNPPEPFGDIVRTHFRLKSRSIKQQLDKWLEEDDGKTVSADGGGYGGTERISGVTSFKADIDEMKKLMDAL